MFNFKEIEGYADHPDGLEFFYDKVKDKADTLPEKAIFLEIGNWKGGSAMTMMQAIRKSDKKERWTYTVDPYGHKPFLVGNEVHEESVYDEEIYRDAMVALSEYANKYELNHTHFRMTSEDFFKIIENIDFWYKGKKTKPEFGCVYIDGDHNPETVNGEIEWLMSRMVKNGLIILDDVPYVHDGTQPYVNMAVEKGEQDNYRCYYEI